MCGIIGYIGEKNASEILLKGLHSLEYRGYDSAGMAVVFDSKIEIRKNSGNIEEVNKKEDFLSLKGTQGIAHTRWATHGKVCKENAHPHLDCTKRIAIVHNGVIENYRELKEYLSSKGHSFRSETDSELIAHLIEEELKTTNPKSAFFNALKRLKGSYAILAIIGGERKIFAARMHSPLILGIGKKEMFFSSDASALLPYTNRVIFLEDGDVVVADEENFFIFNNNLPVDREIKVLEWSIEMAEKNNYPHFMLKEIYEQPETVFAALSSDISKALSLFSDAERIDVVASGTSYHAALIFSILAEKRKNWVVKPYISSEYPAFSKKGVLFAISQSGETADVLQAVRRAKKNNLPVVSLVNVPNSSLARLSDVVISMNAGPEISVAATKTFTSQLIVLYRIAGIDCSSVPQIIKNSLNVNDALKKVSQKLKDAKHVFFIGRGLNYPMAMEGALKLKEISYIHAEAYPAGELKHGPLSLVDNSVWVVALAPSDNYLEKMIGNIKEVKARGAKVLAFTDSESVAKEVDEVVMIERTTEYLYPFSLSIPLQLLAYHTSVLKSLDPDKPRNLAKSVTVE